MALLGKVKQLIGLEEYDDYDEITEEEIAETMESMDSNPVEKRESFLSRSSKSDADAPRSQQVQARMGTAANPYKLIVIEPAAFEDCTKLVDDLKSRKPIIVNLEKMDPDAARKLFDFLGGATYALNGNVQKVADKIFVFAPENVDIAADINKNSIDFGASSKSYWR